VLAKASFPMSPADVAKVLGCSRQVAHNHLRSLHEQRLVVGDGTQEYRLARPEAMAS
jgi:DNA-binding IclR family transcriptional regulator